DDMTGRITRAWTEQHKGTNYYVGYRYKIGPVEHHEQASVSSSVYDQIPQSIHNPKPLPPGEDAGTITVRLRVFSFGRLRKVGLLPPYGHGPLVELIQTLFIGLFWNGILSVFWYKAWIQPIRMKRAARFMLKPPARPI